MKKLILCLLLLFSTPCFGLQKALVIPTTWGVVDYKPLHDHLKAGWRVVFAIPADGHLLLILELDETKVTPEKD